MMDRRIKFILISKCLDRYDRVLEDAEDFKARTEFNQRRFDRFIDLDVSKVDVAKLIDADTETFAHDMAGIFANLERNSDCPEKSSLKSFVPRVGFIAA